MMCRITTVLSVLVLLAACASQQVPEKVRLDSPDSISVEQAQTDPEAAQGKPVRWGGDILEVRNLQESTDIVVLRRGLFSGGEPRPKGGEARRFVARIGGFLDPADYRPGRRLTVAGRLDGVQILKVGEYAYPHPRVLVEQHHRWDEYVEPQVPPWHADPFYCDPFWGPWGYRRPFCW